MKILHQHGSVFKGKKIISVNGWMINRSACVLSPSAVCSLSACSLLELLFLPVRGNVASTWPTAGGRGQIFGVKEQRREMGKESKEHEGALCRECSSDPYPIFIRRVIFDPLKPPFGLG